MNRKQLKRHMLDAIHDGRTHIVWITAAFLALCLILQVLSMSVSGELAALGTMVDEMLATGAATMPEIESPAGSSVLVLAMDIMLIMLNVGFSVACLSTARRQGTSVGNLFDGFSCFLRALCVNLLQSLILSAWAMAYAVPVSFMMVIAGESALGVPLLCLPLLIPAVRAFYNYRQAVFLMLDHPELSAFGCLRVSRELMSGHKWELFKLDLSFLGWTLLEVIPLVSLWVKPYRQVCYAGYYDILVQQYRSHMETAAPPESPDGE